MKKKSPKVGEVKSRRELVEKKEGGTLTVVVAAAIVALAVIAWNRLVLGR